MKWFNECKTIDEVKAEYKRLAKLYHPDLGGDTAIMQEINKAYAFASAKAIKGANLSDEETENEILSSEAYRKAIEAIIYLDGILIELVGAWIWVTGNTRPNKEILKAAGFLFASKKVAWYFRTAEYKVSKGSKKSLDEIREKYGSEVINGNNANRPKHQFLRN
ncbi:MAG: J domain-containing protein [Mucilaginibacter sp.]|uniref:J domain-containing protein n=1 Tax=Mucilaginibacter sp. TaxID=1882438 RepID=UPI0032650D26